MHNNFSGTLLATPLTLSNLNSTSSSNTNGVYFQPSAISLEQYAGQTIELIFHATTNATKPTTFRVDDVRCWQSFRDTGCGKLSRLEAAGSAANVAGMARYGIRPKFAS